MKVITHNCVLIWNSPSLWGDPNCSSTVLPTASWNRSPYSEGDASGCPFTCCITILTVLISVAKSRLSKSSICLYNKLITFLRLVRQVTDARKNKYDIFKNDNMDNRNISLYNFYFTLISMHFAWGQNVVQPAWKLQLTLELFSKYSHVCWNTHSGEGTGKDGD